MNPLSRLISPRYPSAAAGLSGDGAGVVQLERRGGSLAVRSAGYLPLPAGLLRPGFDEPNVADPSELAAALSELVTSAGLLKRRRWSVALPEASTRTSILTMETAPASRAEGEEMLRWKTEHLLALGARGRGRLRSEEHTSELQSRQYLVCRLLLEKKKTALRTTHTLTRPSRR